VALTLPIVNGSVGIEASVKQFWVLGMMALRPSQGTAPFTATSAALPDKRHEQSVLIECPLLTERT
jgi:hypothetical protein